MNLKEQVDRAKRQMYYNIKKAAMDEIDKFTELTGLQVSDISFNFTSDRIAGEEEKYYLSSISIQTTTNL